MNDRRLLRWGVGLAAIIAFAMALFPPWIHIAELPPISPARDVTSKAQEPQKSSDSEKSKENAEPRGDSDRRELHVASTYACIWTPPLPPRDWPVPRGTYWSVMLDTQRLILQYALLTILCGCFWFCFRPKDETSEQ